MEVRCPWCGKHHDLEALEPSFRKPDPYFEVPDDEFEFRVLDSKDAVAIRDVNDADRRYFLRVLAPFKVANLRAPISWGIWVEVSEQHWNRVSELWDAPDQAHEPPFAANLSNELPGYPNSAVVVGMVSLTDPDNIPTFHATAPRDHPFVRDQLALVSPERAADWMVPIYHPEARIPQRQNDTVSELATTVAPVPQRALSRKAPWWRFW